MLIILRIHYCLAVPDYINILVNILNLTVELGGGYDLITLLCHPRLFIILGVSVVYTVTICYSYTLYNDNYHST